MMRWVTLICCLLLGACASPPPPPSAAGLWHDGAFAAPTQRVSASDLFRLSDAMRQRLASLHDSSLFDADRRYQLIDLLYRKHKLALEYDSTVTRTAAETYDAQAGNCLSLAIMTAAFAKELDLLVQFRSVEVEESWTRAGGLYFASGHVNLALDRPVTQLRSSRSMESQFVVDFLPPEDVRQARVHPISEATVVAMFMNNRAAEALARGEIDNAYWYTRESLRQDPTFLAAYNTLGVIYLQRSQPGWAQPVFQALLDREPDNTKVLGNQVQALRGLGRLDEADRLAARLAGLEPVAPYHYFQAGLQAMQQHAYAEARDLFRKEIARQSYNPEIHFWLAQASFRLGDLGEAAKQLELAKDNSNTPHDHAIYAAKLDWLRAHQTQ